MTRVLLTGGTGVLGRELLPRLTAAGHKVRLMSRRAGESNAAGDVEWAQADLLTGAGVAEAVAGIEAIVHAASSPFKKTVETDVEGTRRMLEAAKAAGVGHAYYISIVGIDKLTYSYYKAKLATERVVEGSGVPFTILRATQFHTLLDTFLRSIFKRGPFIICPGKTYFQLIDAGEVAQHMVDTLAKGPSGMLPDIGGPKVQSVKEIAQAWMAARGRKHILLPMPPIGPLGAVAGGANTCPEQKFGKITWEDWLRRTYGS